MAPYLFKIFYHSLLSLLLLILFIHVMLLLTYVTTHRFPCYTFHCIFQFKGLFTTMSFSSSPHSIMNVVVSVTNPIVVSSGVIQKRVVFLFIPVSFPPWQGFRTGQCARVHEEVPRVILFMLLYPCFCMLYVVQ